MQENYILDADAFIRSIKVNSAAPHALFLGAGASITSGIRSANDLIWDWKKEIYLTKNPALSEHLRDIASQNIRDSIQKWIDTEGIYPALNSPEEYSFYIEKAYPISDDRRQFFQNIIHDKKPYIGYHLLCLLAEAEIIKSAWTTNFDGFVSKAAVSTSLTCIDIGLDSTDRLNRVSRRGELLTIALHGDYKYDALKNTITELQMQDVALRAALLQFLNQNHLIVCGYSGRDQSVMEVLKQAYSTGGQGRLYWCGYSDTPNASVKELIKIARQSGREAFYIPSEGFDDLMIRLSQHCLTDQLLERAKGIYKLQAQTTGFTPFSMEVPYTTSLIKSNLFEITLPKEVFQFKSSALDGEKPWDKLRTIISGKQIHAVLLKGKTLAISTVSEISNTFGDTLTESISRIPIAAHELRHRNSVIVNLFQSSLSVALAAKFNLNTNGRGKIWEANAYTVESYASRPYNVFRAAILTLKSYGDDNNYLAIKPTIFLTSVDGEEIPEEAEKDIKRRILEKQRNKEFNQELMRWRNCFFSNNQNLVLETPVDSASGFQFVISHSPVYSQIMKSGANGGITLAPKARRVVKKSGLEYPEPYLQFASKDGTRKMTDFHPIRGLVSNRPFDYALTQSNISSSINLGVICPSQNSSALHAFLNQQHQSINAKHNKEYLIDFPGFETAYGLPISVPQPQSDFWVDCNFNPGTNPITSAQQLAQTITANLERLYVIDRARVVVIFIPTEWAPFLRYSHEGERFDLHDYVKAFAAQKGISTQLITEKTIVDNFLSCQIHWWLSLSFYVKALRTPWVLKELDPTTAFAGIGFSIDHTKQTGKVLMGCSQIFNSQGEGLQFKLSKVDNYTMKGDNPFLSYDDALRLGTSIRQMFFESLGKFPKRVVVHKRTAFTDDEKRGIIDGIGDIETIDLIEINIESDIRFVASSIKNGAPDIDGYPIRRGTCQLLNGSTALLWNHGTSSSVRDINYKYYLGGRRVPAPLLIKKHYGKTNIGPIVNEILGLSKMNWNTFDLYTQLPATIYSSNEIARIGSLLSRFSGRTYDYRFFI
jgi:hypothetical protein